MQNKLTNEEYHANRTHISSSGLKLLLQDQNEYHRRYIQGIKSESTTAFDFGTYVHALILEPETVKDSFAIFTGVRKAGIFYKEFKDANPGKIIISQKEADQGAAIMENFNIHPIAKYLISQGSAETTTFSRINGVNVKTRTDYEVHNAEKSYIVDIKTTSFPLDKHSLEETCRKYEYDLSAALYTMIHKQSKKIANCEFYFIFINKSNNAIQVAKAGFDMMKQGELKVLKALGKYKHLKYTGFFDTMTLDDTIITLGD